MRNVSALSEKNPPLALCFKHNVHNNVAPDAAELAQASKAMVFTI